MEVNVSKMSRGEMVEYLRDMRQRGARDSATVVRIGEVLFPPSRDASKYISKCGISDEVEAWAALEQVCVAALDSGRPAYAGRLIRCMGKSAHGASPRIRRYQAMLTESIGSTAAASGTYASLVAADPADLAAMKRQVAILREAGLGDAAAKQLNAILAVFPGDTETWLELADVYTAAQRPGLAAYCYEEALLALPTNRHLWTRCGEAYYTAGEFVIARKCFAKALELTEGARDAKALLGVCMAATAAVARGKGLGNKAEKKLNAAVHEWARERLVEMLPVTSKMLERQSALIKASLPESDDE